MLQNVVMNEYHYGVEYRNRVENIRWREEKVKIKKTTNTIKL